MAQDLRKLFREAPQKQSKANMPQGHEARFKERLDEALPVRKRRGFGYWAIAASVAVLIGVAGFVWKMNTSETNIPTEVVERQDTTENTTGITLGSLSPDLKKVEDYYVSNINLELAQLDLSGEAKGVADGFIIQLGELDAEYKRLNEELNTLGPNDQTIEALVKNLQLRLQLLYKLKDTLQEFKSSKNEQQESNQI